MKTKTVAFLIPTLGQGGAEKQVQLLAKTLANKRNDVIIITMIGNGDTIHHPTIKIYNLGIKGNKIQLSSFYKLFSLIRSLKVDVLVTFTYPANIAGRLLKLILWNIKLITSIRSSNFGSDLRQLSIKYTKWLDYRTVPNSYNVAAKYLKKHVILNNKCLVINNGLELVGNQLNSGKFNENIKSRIGKYDFLWIAVGRFEIAKDYKNLINACNIINAKSSINWKLIIVGDGSLRNQIFDMINHYSLNEKVHLLGSSNDILNIMATANAFVSSSRWEGSSNAVLEAMFSKLPIVATNVGDNSIVLNAQREYVVSPNSPNELAFSMIEMMNLSDDKRMRIGQLNHENVIEKYTIDKVIIEWEKILL